MRYKAHVENDGWQEWQQNGFPIGTTGEHKKLECVILELTDIPNLGIQTKVHVANHGWLDPVVSSEQAGTTGENNAIEAIVIDLYGSEKENYEVWYRLHVENYGWLEWSYTGEVNGTTGGGVQAEALQVFLCKKRALTLRHDSDFTYLDLTPKEVAGPKNLDEDKIRAEVISYAQTLIGYKQYGSSTIFGEYFGIPNAYWCNCFTSYVYSKLGYKDLVPQASYCNDSLQWFKKNGLYRERGTYTPKNGDWIFFDWNFNGIPDHVGLVEGCDGETDCSIEGNTGNPPQVMRKYWKHLDKYIQGYGIPKFK